MGYLIEDAETITIAGSDIEDQAGKVAVMLGDRVMSFNGVGVNNGLWYDGHTAQIIGRPLTGSFLPRTGRGYSWGLSTGEFITDVQAGGSSDSFIDIGQRVRRTAGGYPFRYRIRSRNPGTGVDRETLEVLQFLRPEATPDESDPHNPLENCQEVTLFTLDRAELPNPTNDALPVRPANLIRIDAHEGGDELDVNTVELHGDYIVNNARVILFNGRPRFTENTMNGAWGPGSPGPHIPPDGYIVATIPLQGGGEWTVHIPFHHF